MTDYPTYLRSAHWQQLRTHILLTRGHRCERCHTTQGQMDVHHLRYDHLGAELPSDVQVVCRRCHRLEHSRGSAQDAYNQAVKLYGEPR